MLINKMIPSMLDAECLAGHQCMNVSMHHTSFSIATSLDAIIQARALQSWHVQISIIRAARIDMCGLLPVHPLHTRPCNAGASGPAQPSWSGGLSEIWEILETSLGVGVYIATVTSNVSV